MDLDEATTDPLGAKCTVAEIFGADPAPLVGKTVTGVKVEGRYGRVSYLRLTFDDGSVAQVGYWASYADDGSLEMDLTGPSPTTP